MLQPKRVKFRKAHRGHRRGVAHAGSGLSFGEFGLKAQSTAWITNRQIEAARRAITHHVRRGGQIWIRIFPDKPVTSKPLETRMGSGKGNVDHWVAVVKRGRMLFEIGGVEKETAKEAMKRASHKLPVATKFVSRDELLQAQYLGEVIELKASDIRALSEVDLERELENSYRETFNLRFRRATNQLTNHREIRRIRRKIARLKTIKRERELAQGQL